MKYKHPIYVYQTGSVKGLPFFEFESYTLPKYYYVKAIIRDETLYFGKIVTGESYATAFSNESEARALANKLKKFLTKIKIKYRDVIVYSTTKKLSEMD